MEKEHPGIPSSAFIRFSQTSFTRSRQKLVLLSWRMMKSERAGVDFSVFAAAANLVLFASNATPGATHNFLAQFFLKISSVTPPPSSLVSPSGTIAEPSQNQDISRDDLITGAIAPWPLQGLALSRTISRIPLRTVVGPVILLESRGIFGTR